MRENSDIEFEPLCTNRFLVCLPEILEINDYCVQTVTLPKCKIHDNVINWEPIIITFLDVIGEEICKKIKNWITSGNEKQVFYIKELDASEATVTTWKILNCRAISIDFGTSSYDYGLLKKIHVTIEYNDIEIN